MVCALFGVAASCSEATSLGRPTCLPSGTYTELGTKAQIAKHVASASEGSTHSHLLRHLHNSLDVQQNRRNAACVEHWRSAIAQGLHRGKSPTGLYQHSAQASSSIFSRLDIGKKLAVSLSGVQCTLRSS